MLMNRFASVLSCAAAGVLCFAASAADAAVVTYTIDPARSSLTIGGSVAGGAASQQTPGSLTTSFSGTIRADRNTAAGTIAFPGGSVVDAALQPSNQQPRSDATPGSQPADYGRTATTPSPFFATVLEAFRGIVLDIEDDTGGAGSRLTLSNTFNSANLVLFIDVGESDVSYGTATAETSLAGKSTSNGGAASSSVIVSGSTETLTLQINSGPITYGVAQTGDSSVTFTGTIVATRPVVIPEPTALAGLATGAGLLLGRRRRA
jgi:hypothetical protein